MKTKLLLVLSVLCLFLSSCFDVEETYNLNADGSYAANYNLNMGQLLNMVNSMTPDSVKQTKEYTTVKDTLVNLGSMPDSIKKKFSAEELAMMKQSDVRMQMNMAQGIFNIGFSNKGKSAKELSYFLRNFGNALEKGKVGDMMKPKGVPDEAGGEPEVPFKNKEYDYVVTPTVFERKVKLDVFASVKEKDRQTFDMLKGMNMKMISTVVVNLPRPAKSVGNPNAVLSADKKQFTLKLDMLEALDKPELLNFKIEY
ncbi:hypothetical protein VRU48_03460 [Pedobacter sp. KR3-3]|uniref:Lipoprotein n=1 Tax=Pedobacter albus TaxID=3113905 RepID=A0ABU7I471_9SPHI|nr:hypothetical protein [Pedobacter sp. KR3-3]MEE1944151.1 hypothetical protein [Pedobacter sp. KR3-3]